MSTSQTLIARRTIKKALSQRDTMNSNQSWTAYLAIGACLFLANTAIADSRYNHFAGEYRQARLNSESGDGFGLRGSITLGAFGAWEAMPLLWADYSEREYSLQGSTLSFDFTGAGLGVVLPLGPGSQTTVFGRFGYEALGASVRTRQQPDNGGDPGDGGPGDPDPEPTPGTDPACNTGTPLDPLLETVNGLVPICDILPIKSAGVPTKASSSSTNDGFGYELGLRHAFGRGWDVGISQRWRDLGSSEETTRSADIGYHWTNWRVALGYERYDELGLEDVLLSLSYTWDDPRSKSPRPKTPKPERQTSPAPKEPANKEPKAIRPLTSTYDYAALGYAAESGDDPARINVMYAVTFPKINGLFGLAKGDYLNSDSTTTREEFYTIDAAFLVGYAYPVLPRLDAYGTTGLHFFRTDPGNGYETDYGLRAGLGVVTRPIKNVEIYLEHAEVFGGDIASRSETGGRWLISPDRRGGYSIGAYVQKLEGSDALTGFRVQRDL